MCYVRNGPDAATAGLRDKRSLRMQITRSPAASFPSQEPLVQPGSSV